MIIGSIAGTMLLLFLVLVVHIAIVTKNTHYDNATLQLGRIDFRQPIDSAQAKEINHQIRMIAGVGNTHFNIKDGILIYSVDTRKNTNEQVYRQLVSKVPYRTELFKVTEEMTANGCPVTDKSTYTYAFTHAVTKIIN